MSELLHVLDNRELALSIWLMLLILWWSAKHEVRSSMKTVGKAAMAKPILLITLALCCYTYLMVVLLSEVEIRNPSQLKPTLIWLFASGLVTVLTANKIAKEERYFAKAAKSNLKLAVVIDFIVNLHVFPFLVEFALIPLGMLFGGMVAYTEHKPELEAAHNFANGVLVGIGVTAFVYVMWYVIGNNQEFATLDNLRSFAVPILLSILFLPFLFLIVVYMAYEDVFARLQFIIKDKSLHSCAKMALLRHVRLNLKVLRSWLRGAWQEIFNSCEEVQASVRKAIAANE